MVDISGWTGYFYSKVFLSSGTSYLLNCNLLNNPNAYRNFWSETEANTLAYIYFGYPTYWKKIYPLDIESLNSKK